MGDEKRPTIADHERSPASDAAEDVEFAPPPVSDADEQEEPRGTAEATEPKTDAEGGPNVPPSRSHH
jgi:hypothetical protein